MGKLGVLSYGVGNVGSILNMLKRVGFEAFPIENQDQISQASRIILPGVGSFNAVKIKLEQSGLLPNLTTAVRSEGVAVLGICVGMQIMFDSSEEGNLPGLGWISGKVKRLLEIKNIKVPHVGWDEIKWVKSHVDLSDFTRFYFTHSYFGTPTDTSITLATCDYGGEFTVAVKQKNITAVQFHPEKSHKNGIGLLKAFASGDLDE